MMRAHVIITVFSLLIFSNWATGQPGEVGTWQAVQRIEFGNDELPPNLYSLYKENETASYLQYCLPTSYSPSKDYPLVLYIPGHHGHAGGNIKPAKDIADGHECVIATLPLFKSKIDRSEPVEGLIMSLSDYSVLSKAYELMLERLYQAVPNIDRRRSGMVGYSNGALAIAVLVSSQDEYILSNFESFCMIEQGMFHLTDLHKSPTKNRRFLLFVGGRERFGSDLKLRGAKLLEDSYQLLGIDIESRILEGVGHELTSDCKKAAGRWILKDFSPSNSH